MTYPLDPLSADEFTAVAAILQREHGVGAGVGGPATSDEPDIITNGVCIHEEDNAVLFFDRNPALDVVGTPPDTRHTDSTSAGH